VQVVLEVLTRKARVLTTPVVFVHILDTLEAAGEESAPQRTVGNEANADWPRIHKLSNKVFLF
jgi:hypothetical protein